LGQGLICIGDGQTTHVWTDNWYPWESLMKPIPQALNGPTFVAELIDPVNRWWIEQALENNFLKWDGEKVVRKIAILSRSYPDCWAWSKEKSGSFSIRSAYRMLINMSNQREAWLEGTLGNSDPRKESDGWRKLWKHEIPPKLRIFAWRIARQSLPTSEVAHHRHIADEATCLICGFAEDSWRHSLMECGMARCICVLLDDNSVRSDQRMQKAECKKLVIWTVRQIIKWSLCGHDGDFMGNLEGS
jgi:hypothetical protein